MKETAQILREKGLKVTPQRIAVYNMLLQTNSHPNADMIYRALEETNPTMSLATVYKTLDYFKHLGLVQELNVGEGSARYDATVHCHPHAVCTCCGKVVDLEVEELTNLHEKLSQPLDFAVSCEQLILYGTCAECQQERTLAKTV